MTTNELRRRVELNHEYLVRLAGSDLRAFVQQAWHVLEPATTFRGNWHIDYVCEHLQAVTQGHITRLVINIPPRYGKSLLTSVFWPVWEWIQRPSGRWIFASYTESLAEKHSLDRRRVLESAWYTANWGQTVRLASDQRTKENFHNTRRGVMLAASMAGSVTGKGGDRIVIDDPHSPEQAESELQRTHVLTRFRQTFSTRLDDKEKGAIVVIMQRLHVGDLTGLCLDEGYQHVCLSAIATTKATFVFPITGRIKERQPEEPLWPERENGAALTQMERALGAYGFAGQYQQAPVPPRGGFFDRQWWRFFDEPPSGGQIFQSWDLSFKGGDNNDYVVGIIVRREGAVVHILDRYKKKASFVETCDAIKTMRARYPTTCAVLVEDAANGPAVVDSLQKDIPGLIAVAPEGGKHARAAAASRQVEAGQVLLPSPYGPSGEGRPDRVWVRDFIETCALFPRAPHDDDVDALSQLVVYFLNHQHVEPASSLREPDPSYVPRFSVFPDNPRAPWRRPQGRLSEYMFGESRLRPGQCD